MRELFFFCAIFAFCLLPLTPNDYGQGRAIPPGVREGERQINAQINEPPAKLERRPADPAKLQEEAAELSKLSSGIPFQMDQVNQGKIPKDLVDQLKRIEKLAKHLRSEVSP